MIDFSAIESEIMSLCTGATTFKSTETGRIRENVPDASMPSCDVACLQHESTRRAGYTEYRIPVVVMIRERGIKRTAGERALKGKFELVCAALESAGHGTAFDVLRDMSSRTYMAESGDTKSVREGVVTLNALAHG